MLKPRIIALYLPQYHPIEENDRWWGKGFTEWANVGRAKSLFKGHYQPRVPADLGYYDLRIPEVREQQAQLAKEAGIEGFCYWHYWFGMGKQLMETIFDEVLESGQPNFPFCLGWANHSWYAKNWNTKDTAGKDRILIKQEYLGIEDYRLHYEFLLKAFRDSRYIKYDGMPVMMIYDAYSVPKEVLECWSQWAYEDGFKKGIYFIGNMSSLKQFDSSMLKEKGFCAATKARIFDVKYCNKTVRLKSYMHQLRNYILGYPPYCYDYKDAAKYFLAKEDVNDFFIPSIIPNYDHSPRSGKYGVILHNATPDYFRAHVRDVFSILHQKKNKLCFLKSWNEWGEGNYMEPDFRYGRAFIDVLRQEMKAF